MFAPRIEYMVIVYISIIRKMNSFFNTENLSLLYSVPGMSLSVEGSLSTSIGLTMTTTDSTTSPSITGILSD